MAVLIGDYPAWSLPAESAKLRAQAMPGHMVAGFTQRAGEEDLQRDLACCVTYVAGDVPGMIQPIEAVVRVARGVLVQGPGMTTAGNISNAFGMITGPIGALAAAEGLNRAHKIHDVASQSFHEIDLARSGFEGGMGIAAVGTTCLSLMAIKSAAKSVSVAANILGNIANTAAAISYFLVGASAAKQGAAAESFAKGLEQAQSVEGERQRAISSLEYIIEQVELSEDERNELLRNTSFEEPVDEEVSGRLLSEDDHDFIQRHSSSEKDRLILTKEISHKKEAKEEAFVRAVGTLSLGRLYKERGLPKEERLLHRLRSEKAGALNEAKDFIDVVISENTKTKLLSLLTVAVCAVGIAGTIMSSVCTAGAPFVVGLVFVMLYNTGMMGIDLRALIEDVKTGKIGAKDKMFMALVAVLSALGTVLCSVFAVHLITRLILLVSGVATSAALLGLSAWKKKVTKLPSTHERIV